MIADGNYHQLIEQNTPMGIEVIENTYMYCKIPAKFKYCPARVKVTYETKSDVKMYMSTVHKMPNASN